MRWLFEDDARRPAQLRVWWTWIIDNRPPHVEVLDTPDARSAAIWHGPDPVESISDSSFPDMLAGLIGVEAMQRKLQGLSVIPAAHPTERHWYLAAVTRPAFRARAAAAVLLPVLERCDAGASAYLGRRTSGTCPSPTAGFVATGVIQVPGGPRSRRCGASRVDGAAARAALTVPRR
jgi:hypothetical protein